MKKLTSMILAVCMTATLFAGCSVSPANQTTETVPSSEQTTVPSTTEGKNFTVEITIPASAFEGQDMTDFDPRMYANDHGYLSAVLNEDGSVTVTMSHTRHLESLKELSEKDRIPAQCLCRGHRHALHQGDHPQRGLLPDRNPGGPGQI